MAKRIREDGPGAGGVPYDGDTAMGIDRRDWRVVRVSGGDAVSWANDLLTADIGGLEPAGVTRSLLLTPTGRIRADLHVYRGEDHLVLVQDPRQPHAIDALLTPYVLSSDVRLDPATVGPICIAPTSSPHAAVDGALWRPGQLAPLVADRGASPVVPAADVLAEPGTAAPAGLELLDERTIDRWRIRAGFARFGPDLDETSFPAEAGLDLPGAGVIEATKGCYLGQESVAKIHNFGHPRRWVQAVRSSAAVETGAPVLADDGAVVGIVTSATSLPEGGSAAIARLDWAARSIALSVADAPLERV